MDTFSYILDKLEASLDIANLENRAQIMNNSDSAKEMKDVAKVSSGCQVETDHVRLRCRQNQINIGKNSLGYRNYVLLYPMYKNLGSDCNSQFEFLGIICALKMVRRHRVRIRNVANAVGMAR